MQQSLGAGGAVIGSEILNVVTKLKAKGYEVRHGELEALTDDEIGDYGLRAIETTFNVPISTLTLRSAGAREDGEYTVRATGRDGTVYTITFVVRGGVTRVCAHHKELP